MSIPLHGPLQAATSQLAADVERVQTATRRLLLAILELDDDGLAAPPSSGLGTRRHVLARCVEHSDAVAGSLGLDVPSTSSETMLRGSLVSVVDAVTTSLGTALAALTAPAAGAPMYAAVAVAHDHLAWLELTLRDLAIVAADERAADSAPIAV